MVAPGDEDALGQEVAEDAEGGGQTGAVEDAVGRRLLKEEVSSPSGWADVMPHGKL